MESLSSENPERRPLDSGREIEHTLRVPLGRPGRPADDDTRGFDYFSTDLHHLSVAMEIRRRFAEKRGFLLLSGPPAPDGKLVQKYLDGAKNRGDRRAARHRATLVECKPEWTFGDVIIACSRELGLGPDAGALKILAQVRREQSKGLMRMLVLDNGDELEGEDYDGLRRFARVDGPPDVLPVVLLVTSRFAERLESELSSLKPAIVGSLRMQHLLPGEVAAFIGYQVDPMNGRGGAAFAPETITAITEAAQGDPRVVNRLMRQDLDLLQRSRGPTLVIPEREAQPMEVAEAPARAEVQPAVNAPDIEEPKAPEMTKAAEPPEAQETPEAAEMPQAAEEPKAPEMAKAAEPPEAQETPEAAEMPKAPETPKAAAMVSANDLSGRSRMARLARGLVAAAATLVVGIYAAGFLYVMAPTDAADDAQRPVAPAAASATDAPLPPVVVAAAEPATSKTPAPAAEEHAALAGSSTPSAPAPVAPVAAAEPSPVPSPVAERPVATAAPPAPAQAAPAEPAAAAPPVVMAEPSAASPAPVDPTPVIAAPAASPPVAAAPPPSPVAAATKEAPPQIAAVEPSAPPPAVARTAPVPATPAALPDPAPGSAAASLLTRADQFLTAGDMAGARELLELAVDTGSVTATAAFRLGQTYDPQFLRHAASRGVAANPPKAVEWYRRAVEAGSSAAAARLAELSSGAAGAGAIAR